MYNFDRSSSNPMRLPAHEARTLRRLPHEATASCMWRSPPCIYAVIFLAEGEGIEPYAVARTRSQNAPPHSKWCSPPVFMLLFFWQRARESNPMRLPAPPTNVRRPTTNRSPPTYFDKAARSRVSSRVRAQFAQGLFSGLDVFYGWTFDASVGIPHFEPE